MPWVKLDDQMPEHPKLAQAGPLALAMQVAGLCYCNRHLTDGRIPWPAARTLLCWTFLDVDGDGEERIMTIDVGSGVRGEQVTADYVIGLLVRAGIWEEIPGGYQIHDYADFQPLRADVIAERDKKKAAGKAGGQARAQAAAKQALKQPASNGASKPQAESKPVPVPDPDPEERESARAILNLEPDPDELEPGEPPPACAEKPLHVRVWQAWCDIAHGGLPAGSPPRAQLHEVCDVLTTRSGDPIENFERGARAWLERRTSTAPPSFGYLATDIAGVLDAKPAKRKLASPAHRLIEIPPDELADMAARARRT